MAAKNVTPFWIRSPVLLVVCWVLVSITLGIGGLLSGMETILPGPSALETLKRSTGEQIAFEAGLEPTDSLFVIVGHKEKTFEDPEFVEAVASVVGRLKHERHQDDDYPLFESVRTFGKTVFIDDREIYVSKDGHAQLIQALTETPVYATAEKFDELPKLFSKWEEEHPNFFIGYLSEGTGDNEIFDLINEDLDKSLYYTLPLTLLILLWAFRSWIAALIPLFIAMISLIASLGISAFFSHTWGAVSATAAQLVVLLVLAIGIDYSLFMVSRVREELRRGTPYLDAVIRARSTTGMAIVWSGVTVACSLFGLLVMDESILTSMAHVSIVAVLFTVFSTVMVLPSVLVLMKRSLEPSSQKEVKVVPWVKLSVKHPILALLSSIAAMLFLSYPIHWLRFGSTMERDILPSSMQSSKAYELLEEYFPNAVGSNFWTIIRMSDDTEEEEEALGRFFDALVSNHEVSGPFEVHYSEDRLISRHQFIVKGNGNLSTNQELVEKIRSQYVPEILRPAGIEGYVTGVLSYVTDETKRYQDRTFLVLSIVLCLSFCFLLVAFRSLAIPVKAILLNLLSTGAAFGLLVALFQVGLVPGWNYGVIETFVPCLLFSILFGLSMDYHVFLLSRIKEEFDKGASTAESVEKGIASTYRTITSAALIMAGVFFVIANLELPIMKQLGVGLAVAVLLDATIIRAVLLPASMVLLGEWNWYLPRWLAWLPKIKIEGE
ncbi:MAG: MMPL family transporter [Bdellovibrionales bacterium]|nr:MMPL family transporter [Bdellovibrionales bacterium]